VLTWPEGNGYIAERLRLILAEHIQVNKLVTAVKQTDCKVAVNIYEDKNEPRQITADHVIFAAPRFVAQKLVADTKMQTVPMTYAPWLVANITLKRLPEARGAAAAWDNVSYYSPSLGYVMANHQEITTRQKPLVITYYYPLSQDKPGLSRQRLYSTNADSWSEIIVRDLSAMHPGIESEITALDIWPWGHGMVSPTVDFIWGERTKMTKAMGNIVFAHSDMSGISNFEEAQYHGIEAAKLVLAKLPGQMTAKMPRKVGT
jgi:hypothetical protein